MRIIFYTGKGGSGKSVISCATGLKLADMGYETLIISSDPAHTLSDAFEKSIQHTPTEVVKGLWAVQVDPLREIENKYGVIQEYVVSVFKARGLDEVLAYEIASLPNMTEFISLLKIVDFVEEGGYDVIVLDTVPSGEALKNIYLPMLLGSISTKLIKMVIPFVGAAKIIEPVVGVPTPNKEVVRQDIQLLEILRRLRDIIVDKEVTSLRLIANPDTFSIQNLRRTYLLASLYNINVDMAIINKIIPEDVEDSYLEEWKRNQEKYILEAEVAFHPLQLKKLKLFPQEIKGLELLRELGEALFKDEDPARVYHIGKPIEINDKENYLEVIVSTPFVNKEICRVDRVGGDLSVVIQTDIGEFRNFIPLPAMVYTMKLEKAKLLNGKLHIYFTKEEK
ncbi:MAG: ArsA family ATPase [Candidatus Methanospirareceae archaeon]